MKKTNAGDCFLKKFTGFRPVTLFERESDTEVLP